MVDPMKKWEDGLDQQKLMSILKMEWVVFLALGIAILASCAALISTQMGAERALAWLPLPAAGLGYLMWVCLRNLSENRRKGEQNLLFGFGWGNRLTLLRGFFIAAMLGFLVIPQPAGWLGWAPGVLYTLACAVDFFDGYVARVTNHASRLGEILDLSFDGIGVLAAALLAVNYGQVPVWYLSVGLARYLFIAGVWLRRRQGLLVNDLPSSLSRRVFAGLQMGFLAAALWPVFSPPGTQIAALLFGFPLLFGFCRDWLYVSGVIRPAGQQVSGIGRAFERWLPVALRGLIVVLNLAGLAAWTSRLEQRLPVQLWIGGLHVLAVVALALGVTPRVAVDCGLDRLGAFSGACPSGCGSNLPGRPVHSDPIYWQRRLLALDTRRLPLPPSCRRAQTDGSREQRVSLERFWRIVFLLALPLIAVAAWRGFSGQDLGSLLAGFQFNFYWLIGLVAFNAAAVLFFNARWWLILAALDYRIPYLATLRYRLAAFTISYFTPGMQFGGEPVQVYALHARHAVPAAQALASVTLDKLFELLANFTFLAIGVLLALAGRRTLGPAGGGLALWAGGLLLLPLVYLAVVWRGGSPLRALAQRLERRLPAAWRDRNGIRLALAAASGAEEQITTVIRRKPVLILQAIAASTWVWILSITEYWLALQALGVQLNLSQTILALTAARLAFLTPLPGGLGALEAGQMLAMQALGLNPLTGIAISLWIRVHDLTLGAAGAAAGSALAKSNEIHSLPSTARDR